MRCTTPPPILKQTHKTYGVDPFQISFRLSSRSSDPFLFLRTQGYKQYCMEGVGQDSTQGLIQPQPDVQHPIVSRFCLWSLWIRVTGKILRAVYSLYLYSTKYKCRKKYSLKKWMSTWFYHNQQMRPCVATKFIACCMLNIVKTYGFIITMDVGNLEGYFILSSMMAKAWIIQVQIQKVTLVTRYSG